MFSWLKREERNRDPDLLHTVADELKRFYRNKLLPLEEMYRYHEFHSPALEDADFDNKPMVLLVGQYSTGKTSFIRHLLEQDFPGMRIGPEPTTDSFIAVMHGQQDGLVPGNALVVDPKKPFLRPSKPRCSIEGSPYFGNEVVLRCKSADGTSPLQYSWEKTSDNKLLPANAVLDVSGCDDGHTSITEDVPAPKSRISTARSFTSVGSQRSSLGSMSPSNLHEYTKSQYNKIPAEEYEAPPSHVPDPPPSHNPSVPIIPPSRLAGPNLSRMGAVPVMTPAQNRDGSIV
ncbi:EH domain-containing protein 1 [Bagarius yarrelli]|uniref:EH domain-containing protein 1 n=1 Tax=Bagarius yarrelli TaxID=175774 RepID=A0A556VVF2_BAGYA|nr:EH domain-containing protein 1 [Bagarius yarrelli]